ncbi:histidine kinase [Streptomyces griseocarneus]|nr:histidine kinase [Streptomyces griseocarneus]
MPLLVGTSGWQYKDWRGDLYPDDCPQRLWLEEYARHFATVENNAAFYRLPETGTFADWRDRTPDGFVMAVKASRFLTHIKRLRDPEEPVHRLMEHAVGLGDRLGPVLLQLPPTLRADPAALDAALACFPSGTRVAVEPRHSSWWTDDVGAVLERHGAALCWADHDSRPVTPLWRTADWGYVRFHCGRAQPWPRYGRQALTSWADRIAEQWPDKADVHVYFNNDPGGAAVHDAVAFARAAAAHGRTVTRTPEHLA